MSPNKYGAVRSGGFDSQFEKRYAQSLDLLVKAGEIESYQTQQTVQFESPITGHLICKYRVDFKVVHLNGFIEWIETKGFETPEWRIKRKLMDELYIPQQPTEIYTVVRMNRYKEPDYLPKKRA